MRAGQELGLRLRTSSIMKACPKIKEKLPKLKLRRKTTPQQEEGERLSHDCSQGHEGQAWLSQNLGQAKTHRAGTDIEALG